MGHRKQQGSFHSRSLATPPWQNQVREPQAAACQGRCLEEAHQQQRQSNRRRQLGTTQRPSLPATRQGEPGGAEAAAKQKAPQPPAGPGWLRLQEMNRLRREAGLPPLDHSGSEGGHSGGGSHGDGGGATIHLRSQ